MIDLIRTDDPALAELLGKHPRIGKVEPGELAGIEFWQGDWRRRIRVGDPDLEVSGLIELMDNNPLVCADEASVPDPISTLALIALGPIALAGMVTEAPTVIANIEFNPDLSGKFLSHTGWPSGMIGHVERRDLGPVLAMTAMAAIATPERWDEIDDIYAEHYSRSFFVREAAGTPWEPESVTGQPWAIYRLRYTPDETTSLLTIQVLADADGKAGRTQLIHAMNVMAGFEESLGIA
ncbi:MAG: hypothetical protein IT203_06370 [Fimbriimonadaceae bacterium]|nr:hypothetical protein [Fimbriimonadaceae bacterium]